MDSLTTRCQRSRGGGTMTLKFCTKFNKNCPRCVFYVLLTFHSSRIDEGLGLLSTIRVVRETVGQILSLGNLKRSSRLIFLFVWQQVPNLSALNWCYTCFIWNLCQSLNRSPESRQNSTVDPSWGSYHGNTMLTISVFENKHWKMLVFIRPDMDVCHDTNVCHDTP